MSDLRPVLFVVGILLVTLGAAMLLPAAVDAAAGEDAWRAFVASAALCLFAGGGLVLTNRGGRSELSTRQAFVLTTLSWVVIAAFGALPLTFSGLGLSYTDAFFEAMSGITTTGATVISGLDTAPPGLLLWRALLQWLGGIGIIVIALAILPMLQVGGMQLFRLESSDASEKALPRIAQVAVVVGLIYFALSAICVFALWAAGMTPFEAIAHAMTTIATGGFSTSDRSIAHFDSAAIDWIVTAFMIVGSLPFLLYFAVLRRRAGELVRDSQVRWFFVIVAGSVLGIALWLWLDRGAPPAEAIREAAFNVVSIITGTGYATADYGAWGALPVTAFLFFMFIGGCAGSTSCGIKIFRYQILFAFAGTQLRRLWQPHRIFVTRYGGKPIPDSAADAVMTFFFAFGLVFAVLAVALSMMGLDFMTAVSGAATAIANVGPGLGDVIGPSGNFAPLPDAAKWLLSAGMLLGRLEIFTVLVLLTPTFWRA